MFATLPVALRKRSAAVTGHTDAPRLPGSVRTCPGGPQATRMSRMCAVSLTLLTVRNPFEALACMRMMPV